MEIISNISEGNKQYYIDFINTSQRQYMDQLATENQIYDIGNNGDYLEQVSNYTPVNDYERRLRELESNAKLLTKKQLEAYERAVEYLSGNKGKQMIMFVSGEGGTGKTFLINQMADGGVCKN